MDYRFNVIDEAAGPLPRDVAKQLLLARPCVQTHHAPHSGAAPVALENVLARTAALYQPDSQLTEAINTAIAVGAPLLLTGEPGTGKTQAAYYVARMLNLGDVRHFQTKSTSSAGDLLYSFDTVRYFHDAHVPRTAAGTEREALDPRNYVTPGELWKAMQASQEATCPAVLLIDEIDKAPRDFPNDLLHEIDQMEFTVREVPDWKISCDRKLRPLVFITSNDERRLPPAFLRRCVTHHIELTDDLLRRAVDSHRQRYPVLDPEFLETAVQCLLRIRRQKLEKPPATGELLAWLQVLAAATGNRHVELVGDVKDLPYLGALIKTPDDRAALVRSDAL